MKKSELKQIIKEEIKRVLNEAPDRVKQGDLASVLQFGKEDPKLGKEVVGGYKAIRAYITGKSAKNLDKLESMGIEFDKAYINFKYQSGPYNTKGRNVAAFNFLGKDSKGNDIRYYKYEGPSAGSGMSLIYVNNKKMILSQYLAGGADLPKSYDIQKAIESITGDWSIAKLENGKYYIYLSDKEADFPILKNKQQELSDYFVNSGLIGYSIVLYRAPDPDGTGTIQSLIEIFPTSDIKSRITKEYGPKYKILKTIKIS